MAVGSLFIAETDPAIRRILPRFLSLRLPRIAIHVANSVDEAHRKLSAVRYSASIVALDLVQEKLSLPLHNVQNTAVLMPVLVTASEGDVDAAREALVHQGAFDVIAKPIHPTEALSSIRIALWQARFLRLLKKRERALRERTSEQIKHHVKAYPNEVEMRAAMEHGLARLEASLTEVGHSTISVELDRLFLDLAVSIQERTKARALDRLNRLIASAA